MHSRDLLPPPNAIPDIGTIAAISLDRKSVSLELGESVQLSVTFSPIGTLGVINWSSSNTKVATVDRLGNVTAVSDTGEATITASLASNPKIYATCKVKTNPITATGISLNTSTLTLQHNQSGKLEAILSPAGAASAISWESSDDNIVTVDQEGNVKAGTTTGSATITASVASNSAISATCNVTVTPIPVTGISIDNDISLELGDTKKLTAVFIPDGTTDTLEWSSDNTSVATVDDEGNVTAVAQSGTAKITVKAVTYGVSATCTVTAAPIHVDVDAGESLANIPTSLLESQTSLTLTGELSETDLMILGDLTALETLDLSGATITAIPVNAFQNSNISSIELPSSLTTIGASAFEGCKNLLSIDLPSSKLKTIDDYAFQSSGLVALDVPNGVETIGKDVFKNCSNMVGLNLPKSIGNFDGTDLSTYGGIDVLAMYTTLSGWDYTAVSEYGCEYTLGGGDSESNEYYLMFIPGFDTNKVTLSLNTNLKYYSSLWLKGLLDTDDFTVLQGLSNLKYLDLSGIENQTISEDALSGCTDLVNLTLPNALAKKYTDNMTNVTSIYGWKAPDGKSFNYRIFDDDEYNYHYTIFYLV